MIDSSGRRALRADGTVLDMLPIGQTLAITGALLVALFVLVRPEASNGLGTFGRIAFWALHVGLGLSALIVSSRWLASGNLLPNSTIAAVLISGFAAIIIAAPGYLALDALFAPYVIDLDVDPAAQSLTEALVGEVLDLTLWFLAAWFLINLPVLLPRPAASTTMNDIVVPLKNDQPEVQASPEGTDIQPMSKTAPRVKSKSITQASSKETESDSDAPASLTVHANSKRFLKSLPGVVGIDVIAIASDLHYLNVWTVAGRTTVLGNLKDVVTDLGDIGMQVHRSHWVAHAHVRRIVGTASNSACILSNELRVPISRRRWKAVQEHYGRGLVHTVETRQPQTDT